MYTRSQKILQKIPSHKIMLNLLRLGNGISHCFFTFLRGGVWLWQANWVTARCVCVYVCVCVCVCVCVWEFVMCACVFVCESLWCVRVCLWSCAHVKCVVCMCAFVYVNSNTPQHTTLHASHHTLHWHFTTHHTPYITPYSPHSTQEFEASLSELQPRMMAVLF